MDEREVADAFAAAFRNSVLLMEAQEREATSFGLRPPSQAGEAEHAALLWTENFFQTRMVMGKPKVFRKRPYLDDNLLFEEGGLFVILPVDIWVEKRSFKLKGVDELGPSSYSSLFVHYGRRRFIPPIQCLKTAGVLEIVEKKFGEMRREILDASMKMKAEAPKLVRAYREKSRESDSVRLREKLVPLIAGTPLAGLSAEALHAVILTPPDRLELLAARLRRLRSVASGIDEETARLLLDEVRVTEVMA